MEASFPSEAVPDEPYIFLIDTALIPEGPILLDVLGYPGGDLQGVNIISQPIHLTVDRTSPTVTTRIPSPGATSVDPSVSISIGFSEAVSAPSALHGGVLLQDSDSAALPFTPTLSADQKTLSLAPASGWPRPVAVHAMLSATVTDLAGNPLVLPQGSWSWSIQ